MKRILTIITMSAATLWSAAAAAPDAIEVPCIDRPATAVTAMSARHIMSASEALEAAPAAPAKAPAAKAPEGEWADKGSVMWHEGILSVFSDIPEGLSWSVPVQESVSAPGYYRMQPYASESCPVAQTIGRTNAAWFYFNATDPAKVYLEDPEGWYFTLSQIVPENGWEDAGARYGTFRDNVMDFPAQSFAIYLSVQEGQEPQWNAVNLKGQFMIVFPGGEVKDHSIAVDSDICGAGSTAQLRLSTLGKDVRGVKVGVFEGYYDAVSPEMITAVVAQGASVDAAAGKAVNLRLRGRGMRTALAVTTDAEGLGREAAVAYMIATEDDAAQWRAVGRGSMTDGIMSCYYGYEIPVETFDVDIEENIERPGYYRIANPYARHTVFGPFHGLLGHDDCHYLYVDATDPDKVDIEASAIGYGSPEIGQIYIWSEAGYLTDTGYGWLADLYSYGTLADGVITFPEDAFVMGCNLDNNGQAQFGGGTTFRLVLPDGAGVDAPVVGEDGEAQYYNLQGLPVAEPSSGLYIRRQGGKATKVLVK